MPVYRFFSTADGTHSCTASGTEATDLNPARFVAEGTSFYAPSSSSVT